MATVLTDVFVSLVKLDGLARYMSGMRQMSGAWGELEGKMSRLERVQRGATIGAVTFGGVLGSALNQAAKFEQTEIGFRTLLGGADAAKKKLEELQKFAKESPFNFQETARLAQRALAQGIEPDRLLTVMRAVGNAVAAAGGGTEEFAGAMKAIGDIMNQGTLQKEELNQLAERGIPAFEIFRKELGLTAEQVKEIGRAGIKSRDAIDAFVRGSNRMFAGSMENQSKTLLGRISTLEDETQEIGRNIAKTWVPALATASRHVSDIVAGFGKLNEKTGGKASGLALGIFGGLAGLAVVAGAIRNIRTLLPGAAAAGGGASAAAGGAAGAGIVATLRKLLPSAKNVVKWGPMAGKLGVGLGIPLAFLSWALGTDSTMGKGVNTLGMGLTGAALGKFFGPWGALIGGAAGLGLGAWNTGLIGGGKGGAQQEKQGKTIPQLLQELIDVNKEQKAAIKDLGDLRAGVGSQDILDVMGEARAMRLLAGRIGN